MNVLSLFNGISCGRVALDRAGIPVERYVSYEIDKYANMVSKSNYPLDEYNGNVFEAEFTQHCGFDLLIGGSPCTHWSIAKQGRETTSSGVGWELFMQYVRALRESGCRWFLYENNHRIHKDIRDSISRELGVYPIMINSGLVSAQNRYRLYWTNIPNITQPTNRNILLDDIIENGLAYSRKAYPLRASCGGGCFVNDYLNSRRTHVAVPAVDKTESKPIYNVLYGVITIEREHDYIVDRIDLPDGDYTMRKLTVTECCRLQTLPDDYCRAVSATQGYKGLGNGWTVDVIAHILRHINRP